MTSLFIQRNVIFALLIREIKTRFGKYNLGYLWALLEPIAHLGVLMFVFGQFRKTMPGVDYMMFLLSGIVPWLFFLNSMKRSSKAVEANKGIFFFRNVKPLDTVLARVLLEAIIQFFVLVVLISFMILIGRDVQVANPLMLATALLSFLLMVTGVSLLMCVLGALYTEVEKIVNMFTRPLFFFSGIFIPVQAIPMPYREWLLYNPLVHYFDWIRIGLFAGYQPQIDLVYANVFMLVILFVACNLYSLKRFEMLAT